MSKEEFNNKLSILIGVLESLDAKKISLEKKKQRHFLRALWHYKRVQHFSYILSTKQRVKRNLWVHERSSRFWEEDIPKNGDAFFKQNFRMNRTNFNFLCGKLQCMKKKDTTFRRAIPLEKRIAIALYALGSSSEYRTIGHLFGVGRSTVGEIVLEFCRKVAELEAEYINAFPLKNCTIEECCAGFQRMGLPQCLGALDCCHIEVFPPVDKAFDYHNSKGWNSVVLLALADHRYRFMYINVEAPCRRNDSQIFHCSSLEKYLINSSTIRTKTRMINEVNVPVYIIGDASFSLSEFLIKPYPFNSEKNTKKENFNDIFSKCRRVVDNAFGHLKARFRRIGKGVVNEIENAKVIIRACCIIHNFLIAENDVVLNSWLREQEDNLEKEQPRDNTTGGDSSISGNLIRDTLADFLSDQEFAVVVVNAAIKDELDDGDGYSVA